jgi:hypothetical protein
MLTWERLLLAVTGNSPCLVRVVKLPRALLRRGGLG